MQDCKKTNSVMEFRNHFKNGVSRKYRKMSRNTFLIAMLCSLLFFSCGQKNKQSESGQNNKIAQTENGEGKKIEISSQTKAKIEKIKKQITSSTKRLSSSIFVDYDFSKFWKGEYSLGYIGTNFQRMYITFEKVRKISETEYSVEGFSQVKSNVCNFKGTIKNIQYNQYKNYWEDECGMYEDGISNQGCLIADFEIAENPDEKSTGIFLGLLESFWVIDSNGQLHQGSVGCGDSEYDDQFFGEWASYKGGTKPVAWGSGRLHFTEGLDVGDGEFMPDQKYINNGWDEYKQHFE